MVDMSALLYFFKWLIISMVLLVSTQRGLKMANIINGRTLKRLLAPSNRPPNVSREDFEKDIEKMARHVQIWCQMAESGPFPAPPQSPRLIDRIKRLFSRPSPH